MSHDAEWSDFQRRRDELRRERRAHTPLELPDEFRYLATHVAHSLSGCGESHAAGVAQSFGASFGWNPDDLVRGAMRL